MDVLKNTYNKRITFFEKEKARYKKRLGWVSLSRLTAFLLILGLIFSFGRIPVFVSVAGLVLFLILFAGLIRYYQKLTQIINHISLTIDINLNELKALENDYSIFESGKEFVDPAHPFSYDMDIVGEGSVYQYLNRTVTLAGKEKLANELAYPSKDTDIIVKRQESISELADMIDLRQDFMAAGKSYSEKQGEMDDLLRWVNESVRYMKSSLFRNLIVILPAIALAILVLSFFISGMYNLLIFLILGQLAIVGNQLKYTNRIHEKIGKRMEMLKKYSRLFNYFEKPNFQSSLLSAYQKKLYINNESATMAIHHLSGIISAFDNRLNLLVGFLLNGLLLWDIQCMIRLEKWQEKYRNILPDWFDALGGFDALSSFSNFRFNHPGYVFPEISENKIIEAQNIGHPLIVAEERVCNDFELAEKGNFVIVTGANMAGKSTFLRTIGVNWILAMAGAPVCADKFVFNPEHLFTSMRTSDSLQKSESYFYAELKRLKELIDRLKNKEHPFIILDEILKGTNSVDKQAGSQTVLQNILKLGGTGLIATHDLELAKMEKQFPDRIINKCFEIEINGAEIFFDYKLIDGITKKMNATLLMEQMGILSI